MQTPTIPQCQFISQPQPISQTSHVSQTNHTGITLHLDLDALVFIGCLLAGLVGLSFGY
jgi:hypothetical protein